MSDCLLIAVISYYVLLYRMDDLEDGYDYVYHDDYCIYFNYFDDACVMHIIVYRCKPNSGFDENG
jgi:hypothetical protein